MDNQAIASCFNLLGGVLYLSPEDAHFKPLFDVFYENDWVKDWPFGQAKRLAQCDFLFKQNAFSLPELTKAHTALFIGPDHLQASPWGSVYLDHEKVIFGQSTLDLREFLEKENISHNLPQKEPEDHIGLLFLTYAWLATENREKAMSTLLSQHIMPWALTYFGLLKDASPHPFYKGIAELSCATLEVLT